MSKATKSSSPALRLPELSWVIQPQAKAEMLAVTFSRKWIRPPAVIDEFAAVPEERDGDEGFLALRARRARQ
eukprot:178474-Alexandrium_andersonii.AAC.1